MIELLIVIAIIAMISIFFINNFPGAQEKARDAQRKSDLKQYQNALFQYASKNQGFYPAFISNSTKANVELCSALNLSSGECPADPKDGVNSLGYYYQAGSSDAPCGGCDNGNSCAKQFTLRARLEKEENQVWVVCSNGSIGSVDASASFSCGSCPL